jgi:hypothetical protein
MVTKKQEIISFKVDETILEALKGIQNRSEFIRSAVLSALSDVCPLCKGVGTLTPNQRAHWDSFAHHHTVTECDDCHEVHLVCDQTGKTHVHE